MAPTPPTSPAVPASTRRRTSRCRSRSACRYTAGSCGPTPADGAGGEPPYPRRSRRPRPDPQVQGRIKALEQQVAELKRQEAETTTAYQAARRVGDSPAQRAASARSREIRAAMNAPLKELMEIRQAERLQRNAENARQHEAAVAQNKAMLANRRVAHVTINTNSGRALSRASRVVSIPGTSLAITQLGISTSLLFGNGWTHQLHEAFREWSPSAPTSRVQDVNVRVEGNDESCRRSSSSSI
jgi:hypothetical protein